MDHEVMLAQPLAAVFDQLAAPLRLAAWLPEVVAVEGDAGEPGEIGTSFGLRLRRDGREIPATGELIAYEPPWYVAYRLECDSHTYVLRLTCVNVEGATRVSVHQADAVPTLAIDLSPLAGPGPTAFLGAG
jgi:uncharacterized protein YndB with AHSA1/START domain